MLIKSRCSYLSALMMVYTPSPPPVAYPELLRYQGTHTLSQYDSHRFCAILVFNSRQNHVYAWLLRSFTRAQTNSTRAYAPIGPGVAMPLFSGPLEHQLYMYACLSLNAYTVTMNYEIIVKQITKQNCQLYSQLAHNIIGMQPYSYIQLRDDLPSWQIRVKSVISLWYQPIVANCYYLQLITIE